MGPSELEILATRARRVYELGRLRIASQVAVVVLPLATLAVVFGADRANCLCVSAMLLVVSVGARWLGQGWEKGVVPALLAGSVPMIAGLVEAHLDVQNVHLACVVLCSIGLASGAIFASRLARSEAPARLRAWILGASIAAVTAFLGCIGGSPEGPVGLAAGTLVTAGYLSLRRPRPASVA